MLTSRSLLKVLVLLTLLGVNGPLRAVENGLRPRPAVPASVVQRTQHGVESVNGLIAAIPEQHDEADCDCEEEYIPGRLHRAREGCVPFRGFPGWGQAKWRERIQRAWEGHADPNDPLRHFGVGEPLLGTSWRNRPWYVGAFAGGIIGDELQSGLVDQGGGFFAGGRFGGDFDHFWGGEVRFAMSDLNVNYPGAIASGQSRDTFFDGNLLYYPLGDTRWRPYFSLGFGVAGFKYTDAAGTQIHASGIELPFGGGLKYLLSRHWAMRFEIMDNFTFDSGSHADAMHNITFTGGVEFHFGGHTVNYGPW